MPQQTSKRRGIFEFALIFAAVYLLTQFAFRTFFPQQPNGPAGTPGVVLEPVSARVKEDLNAVVVIRNQSSGALVLPSRCPMPPVEIYRVEGTGSGEKLTRLSTEESALPCEPLTRVAAHAKTQIDLGSWKYSLLSALGTYEVRLPDGAVLETGTGTSALRKAVQASARFTIRQAGPVTQLFRALITKPFLNFLIFIASILPNHDLGIGIIVLTVLVKLLLYIPTQHAMEGQRKMQKVQPHLDEVRRRHKDDPKRMQEETMKLWKEHGINPFQSCLPMLIQLPILIGLFYVIRDGSQLALSRHLIYGPYLHLAWTFNTHFLGLDLLKPSIFIFPPLLVVLQFAQMKLSFMISARKKKQQSEGKEQEKPKEKTDTEKSQLIQQRMMLYGLPLMIGVFAYQFPAAVSLYWGVSTLFAIGQQVVVNRRV